MRLKYYLRGIGAGIVLATLLLGISFYFNGGFKASLSDEEIIARAEELGMTMPEANQETEETTDTEDSSENEDASSSQGQENEPADVTEVENTLEVDTSEAEDPNADVVVTYIPFSVRSGESSEMISNNLYNAGLIDDATEFNKYLNELGVDDRIPSGSFYIQSGSEYDDIVAVLVNKEVRTTTPPAE